MLKRVRNKKQMIENICMNNKYKKRSINKSTKKVNKINKEVFIKIYKRKIKKEKKQKT